MCSLRGSSLVLSSSAQQPSTQHHTHTGGTPAAGLQQQLDNRVARLRYCVHECILRDDARPAVQHRWLQTACGVVASNRFPPTHPPV